MNIYDKFNTLKNQGFKESNNNIIGELSEKTLHNVIKNLYSENIYNQEIKIGNYYVDVLNGDNIIEVQTKQFNKLRNKIEYLLSLDKYNINIIYPVFDSKLIYVIDDNNNINGPKKSTKKLKYPEIFYELYKIKNLLLNDKLTITILVFSIDEYRKLYSNRKGYINFNRVPNDLKEEIILKSKKDYLMFLPKGINNTFTSKDISRLTKCNIRYVGLMLNVMKYLDIIEVIGKNGNQFVYKIKEEAEF